MSNIYPIVTIGEVCSVGDGAHSKVKRQIAGIKYLTSKNIGFGHLKLDKFDYISLKDYEHLFSTNSRVVRRPCPGDVLIGIIGTFGNAYRYKSSDKFGVSSSIAILRPNQSILEPDFLYYVVTSNFFKVAHKAYKSGSVQAYTNIPTIKCLPIPLPPLPEQKAIASILSSLDDKIELNQQMNQTLEAIARAIFKSWFVDFDPVRAKMAGNQPVGMDAATANLFPDSFEESALGLIPRGWTVKSADNICNVAIGKTPPRKESYWFSTNDNNIRWVSIRDMGENGLFISDTKEYLVPEAIERFNIKVIPDNTVLFSFKLTIGRVVITDGEMTTNEAIAHFNIKNQEQVSSEYLYSYLKNFDYNQLGNTSSIAQAVNSKIIKTMPILIPDSDLINHFTKQVNSIFIKIKTNQRESRTLANIRDTLLPKLMSGEIRVKEAETIIKEVN